MSELQQAVKKYLEAVRRVSKAGATERSYYSALEGLFNDVGRLLSPKVQAVIEQVEPGRDQPDLGLSTDGSPQQDRGAVEVKKADAELAEVIESEQVKKYWDTHKLVLVTNLRQFALVGEDADGEMATLERYSLAESGKEFDELLKHPQRTANPHGDSLGECLLRVMSHRSTISEPRDLARLLASYARDALQRVERSSGSEDSLKSIREALEQALGMSFDSADGGKFFRSTLVQTLFYGVFAAWVMWAQKGESGKFEWGQSAQQLRAPVLRMLFHQLVDPGLLERLSLDEVLDWTEAALERVDRDAFLQKYGEGEAVQYFYEPFLEAFDPDLRKELGVWYTPREIVRYMVTRVDRALRDDLGIAKGLADERVYVLDPCCGTGAYLIETLRRIEETERASGSGAATAAKVRDAAMKRVFGFEIMPAPLVVSHLEIGLALDRMDAGLSDDQRASVLLTNALTGWEPETTKRLPWPELEKERQRARAVKQDAPILVVMGNPPYNGFPGISANEEERDLSDAYRDVKGVDVPKPEGQGLNDLFVRFFRMAERRITEKTGEGIVCFISNYSWLDRSSYPGMRQRYLQVFDNIRIDNLNGDRYRNGKRTPDGKPDPSVFSTQEDPVGIQLGTAIATLVRKRRHKPAQEIEWRQLWGVDKLKKLEASAAAPLYQRIQPLASAGLPFWPVEEGNDWPKWPTLVELFPTHVPGVKTNRDSFVIDIDYERLAARIADYFDTSLSHEVIRERWPVAMRPTTTVKQAPEVIRSVRLKRGVNEGGFRRYVWRPFDVRWIYWEPEPGLIASPSPQFGRNAFEGNLWIEARKHEPKEMFQRGTVVSSLADNFGNGMSEFVPLYLRDSLQISGGGQTTANLSGKAEEYIASLDASPENLFHHVIATLHDPVYREANAGGLRMGWPRIPLPDDRAAFFESAERGSLLARLLDTESDVGALLDIDIAVPTTTDGTPMQADDFRITAGWGHFGANQAVMPGQGKIKEHGSVVDVHLNERACWSNIPSEVWEYRLGGYQVLKKWLSYREEKVLGRPLKPEELSWFSEMAKRIAVILSVHD